MHKIFDELEVDLACPQCGTEVKKSLAWLEADEQFTCAGCSSAVTLDKESAGGLKEADDAIKGLDRAIAGINRRLKK